VGTVNGQISLLNSITLLAAAFGAIIFGRIADILGASASTATRVLILAIRRVASAFAPKLCFPAHLPCHPGHRHRGD